MLTRFLEDRPSKRLRGTEGVDVDVDPAADPGCSVRSHVGGACAAETDDGSDGGIKHPVDDVVVDGCCLPLVGGFDSNLSSAVKQTPAVGAERPSGDDTAVMYSLERRFVSQQVLQTPIDGINRAVDLAPNPRVQGKLGKENNTSVVIQASEGDWVRGIAVKDCSCMRVCCSGDRDAEVGPGKSLQSLVDDGDKFGDEDDGEEPLFRIKSQLTYERVYSSQFSFDDGGADVQKRGKDGGVHGWQTPCLARDELCVGMQRELSANDLENACFQSRFVEADEGDAPGTSVEHEETGRDGTRNKVKHPNLMVTIPSQEHVAPESETENRLTPAVHSADRVQLNNPQGIGFFPIFRSKKDCKIVYLIRHGESEFNAACSAKGSSWEDPLLFDARLTMKGKTQALSLRKEVESWDLPGDVVWVTSPLTRALETLLHVHPDIEPSAMKCRASCGRLNNVVILPEVTEKLHTSGDVGRNPCDLQEEFPMLELGNLKDNWWFNKAERPNCPYRKLFQSHETKDSVTGRIKQFRKWIIERPEKAFVAVGHSMFWRDFATSVHNGIKQETMRNCEWRVLHV
jgi:broad specificity phosphatase PhoE